MNDSAPGAAAPDPTGEGRQTVPPAPAARTSRAGRNLPAAIAVGVGLLVLAAASLYWAKWVFAIVGIVAVWLGAVEISKVFGRRGIHVARMPLLLSLPIIAVAAYRYGPVANLVLIALLVLVILAFRLPGGAAGYLRDTTASVFLVGYLPLMLGFAILTLSVDGDGPFGFDLGAWLIVTYVLLTVGSDIGGYIAGVMFGKHAMFPSISPKKSWEGFAGSLLLQSVLGALLFTAMDEPWWQGVVMGLAMTCTATLGDFIESALKRDLEVKDMGDMIPGHGGVMDRLDSLIPNAFVSWAFFAWFLSIT